MEKSLCCSRSYGKNLMKNCQAGKQTVSMPLSQLRKESLNTGKKNNNPFGLNAALAATERIILVFKLARH